MPYPAAQGTWGRLSWWPRAEAPSWSKVECRESVREIQNMWCMITPKLRNSLEDAKSSLAKTLGFPQFKMDIDGLLLETRRQ